MVHKKAPHKRGFLKFCCDSERWLAITATQRILDDAHELAILRSLALEFDVTVLLRKQGVIAPEAYIDSRVEARATLAHDDIARRNGLAAVNLDAKTFTL